MGSDLARISFDPTRGYRSVVAQQGRVTLEADVNEEAKIASEALRLETIDIVGPAGTPAPTGYQVYYDAADGLAVRPGIMYLGGWRLTEDSDVPFRKQPDWLTRPTPASAINLKTEKFVAALLAIEQSISATEDQALREVALGGPDTSARTRLMQHFVLIPTTESLCEPAGLGVRETLVGQGLTLNPATAELTFDATLKVSFFPPLQQLNPCCPSAQGGYLGADNQLVQVTVSEFSSLSGKLLWGWNNASFLYRATAINSTVLQLNQTPVDAAHTPQPGQVIEILQTEAVLGNAIDQNYVAAPQGTIITLGTGSVYDPTTQQLTLPAGTTIPSESNSLFVRLWQAEVPFTSGKEVHLDDVSGLAVTVSIKALPTNQLTSRPFWCFAVRPNTPQQVYPSRYRESAQFPDGPRQWLCDLAIVQAVQDSSKWIVLTDCRNHFLPLTDQQDCDCCQLTLDPTGDWATKLATALAGPSSTLNICLQPGQFDVTQKITFTKKSVKITGAGQGSILSGTSLEAVLEFDACPDVVLWDLSVAAGTAGYSNNPATAGLQGAVTMKACTQIDIERVFLSCADSDLRSASCLAIFNPAPAATQNPSETHVTAPAAAALNYNARILNSQFTVGHCQVGILMVNADRAQIEGNLIVTPLQSRNLTYADLATNKYLVSRLRKQLLRSMTIESTAPPTSKKATRRLLRKARKLSAATSVPTNAPATAPAAQSTPNQQLTPTPNIAEARQLLIHEAALKLQLAKTAATRQLNLGALGLSHINATYGVYKLQFISSQKLTNAWTDALSSAGLNQNSTAGEIHKAVHKIADAVFLSPKTAPQAMVNWTNSVLPNLYSTAGQGIVVGGTVAQDIRILNNTVEGSAQGIHVGLGDGQIDPAEYHLEAGIVRISGNSILIRTTAETTGGRHGISLSGVQSAIVNDNHVQNIRLKEAGQEIDAIRLVGSFGRRMLVEGNSMAGFTAGLWIEPRTTAIPKGFLWKAADNASDSDNSTSCFLVENNVP